ncbi:MAG: TerB family tellurite resistance protein [Planctomycetota bacterium]
MTTPARRTVVPRNAPVGALVGAGLGLFLGKGSLPGLVIGALLGHLFQKQLAPQGGGTRSRGLALERATALLRMAVAVARLDGEVAPSEREAIRSYFQRDAGLPPSSLAAIDRMIDACLQEATARPSELAGEMPALDAADRVHVLFVLFRVALADRQLQGFEESALLDAALALGLSRADFEGIRAHFVTASASGGGGGDDYTLLGLAPGADLATVKAKYREAVKNYHPDRFQHLGEEFTSVAEEKFKRIHEAYERITKGTSAQHATVRLSVCQNFRLFSPTNSYACPRCRSAKHEEREGKIHIRCPFCTQSNAFPRSATEGQVRCGNCKVLLVR